MIWLRRLVSYFSLLSLDVVFGAVAGMYFFSSLLHVESDVPVYFLLGQAVWVIYTGDHLLDIRKSKGSNVPRRQFYERYSRFLLVLMGVNILSGLLLAIQTFGFGSELYLSMGLALSILVTMFLLRKVHSAAAWLKELSTAIFYVLGVAWLPLLRVDVADFSWESLVFLLLYMGLAWLNLLMLSYLDREEDSLQGFQSIAQKVSPERLLGVIRMFSFALILISIALFLILPSFYSPFACVLLLMLGFHYLSFFSSKGSPEAKRRQMEWYFVLPVVLALL